jgi:hypothetical protein
VTVEASVKYRKGERGMQRAAGKLEIIHYRKRLYKLVSIIVMDVT